MLIPHSQTTVLTVAGNKTPEVNTSHGGSLYSALEVERWVLIELSFSFDRAPPSRGLANALSAIARNVPLYLGRSVLSEREGPSAARPDRLPKECIATLRRVLVVV